MKLLLVLMLAALTMALPRDEDTKQHMELGASDVTSELARDNRNFYVNILIRQLILFVRRIIRNGWPLFGIPPLDPLEIKAMNLTIPAELINLDLELKNVLVEGFGQFVVHRSNLNLRELTFDIDISLPVIRAEAEHYNMVGDVLTALPLYGKGGALFNADGFRFRALLFLKQSEDGTSILIDRVENAGFDFPHLKSELTGVIGGGDIDAIVNAMVEEVIFNYINRFQGVITHLAASVLPSIANPFLNQLDTWIIIAPFLPRPRDDN